MIETALFSFIDHRADCSNQRHMDGVYEGSEAFIISALEQTNQGCIFVAKDASHLKQVSDMLNLTGCRFPILEFPAWDCVPYGRSSPAADIQSQRLKSLWTLTQAQNRQKPFVILTTINAISQRTLPAQWLRRMGQKLCSGASISMEQLLNLLNGLGYERVSIAREAGEFAVRGGILDIYPIGYDTGVRVDFFGDEIESLRLFDVVSQKSHSDIKELELIAASEVILNDDTVQHFRTQYRMLAGEIPKDDLLYQSISSKKIWPGMEHWLPLFYQKTENLLDYAPELPLLLGYQTDDALKMRIDAIQDYYMARKAIWDTKDDSSELYVPIKPQLLYETKDSLQEQIQKRKVFLCSPFKQIGDDRYDLSSQRMPKFYELSAGEGSILSRLTSWINQQELSNIIITYKNISTEQKLKRLFEDSDDFTLVSKTNFTDAQKVHLPKIALLQAELSQGIIYGKYGVISDDDILGQTIGRSVKSKRKAEDIIHNVGNLNEGDLVVHHDHGIGRYEGLKTVTALGASHDCLKILYHGDDRLYVPVENLDMLSRFGSDQEVVQLDKLGSTAWQSRKAKAKERIGEMAEKLMKIAAQRTLKKAPIMSTPQGAFEEFCDGFGYQETEDQQKAINDTLYDLASGTPMDRLICGDVGFGKTEVALRAAFMTAISGYQVALIVPTTLLARQHYNQFVERFKDFPVRVAQLSRLVSAKTAKQTKLEMKNGWVDIVIGTHALLSKDIHFHRLGLVIIDEEQHFGVSHKERLKSLKHDAHILTLTATPIPRTLQMALTGVRSLSIIATPPVDRLAIRTFVQKFDKVMAKEAILREKYREGQSFFVCPRVKDVNRMDNILRSLLPDVKIATVHGQMPIKELEDTIAAFADGQFDVLLSTQIVESGIDLPNVNTIIIYRADMFGLAQLYQLRGRVGRSSARAWAWLMLDERKVISKTAQQRLEVMQTLDHLGAGFSIASHDLDHRGAGNLLGEEQSGHIKEVGIELYQQMLEQAVLKAREAGSTKMQWEEAWSTKLNLGLNVMIPKDYIPDLDLRMSFYRQIANLNTLDELEMLADEMYDRFGKRPQELDNLFKVSAIKQRCKALGIVQLDAAPKGLIVQFYNNVFVNPAGLLGFIQQHQDKAKVRPDQSIVWVQELPDETIRLKAVDQFLRQLEMLAGVAPA